MLISFLNADIVVPPPHIKFHIDMCVAQVMNEIQDEREWILITHGESIDPSVILYQSQFSILLLMKKKGDAYDDLDILIYPFLTSSLRNFCTASSSVRLRGYTLQSTASGVPFLNLIV